MSEPCARARKILADLDKDRRAAAKQAGQRLVWDAAELTARGLIVDVCGRSEDLAADYAAAADAKTRVKISAELRQLEIVLVRLMKQFHTRIPAAPSLRSIKASRAARERWDRADAG